MIYTSPNEIFLALSSIQRFVALISYEKEI